MFDKLVALTRQLYPTGRAFKMPLESEFAKLTQALVKSEERFYMDAVSILNSILPDNAGFTADDATDWENRLGLPVNPMALLVDRMAAITRKLNDPGINPAKAHYLYLQTQLQLANFNVYVYENIPPTDPATAGWSNLLTQIQYGNGQQYGGTAQYGSTFSNRIINYIDELKDQAFNMGGVYNCAFFIGGATIGSTATVPSARKAEFRELILKTKQPQVVGFLFVNYV